MPAGGQLSRRRTESGVVGGSDALVVGVMVFVIGTLAIVNLWSIIDTRMRVASAAREYVRTFTEAPDAATAAATAEAAAVRRLPNAAVRHGTVTIRASDAAAFGPCATVWVVVSMTVPTIRLPFGLSLGHRTVSTRAADMVDAYRQMTPGPSYRATGTACQP